MADPPLQSPITPHFFKPLLPGFTNHIDIPIEFFSKHIKVISNNDNTMKLKSDASEITWEVKMNGQRLCDGWEDFAVAHDLRVGDFVVFRHEGEMTFHATPFGPSCCEVQYAPFCANNNEDTTDDVKTETFSSNKSSSESNSLSDDSDHSRFVCHVTASSLSCDSRDLPKIFTIPNGVSKNCKDVILINEEGKSWNLELKYKNFSDEFNMRRGWRSFCEANGIKAGDSFTFELVQNGKRGKPLVLQLCLLNSGNQDKPVIHVEEDNLGEVNTPGGVQPNDNDPHVPPPRSAPLPQEHPPPILTTAAINDVIVLGLRQISNILLGLFTRLEEGDVKPNDNDPRVPPPRHFPLPQQCPPHVLTSATINNVVVSDLRQISSILLKLCTRLEEGDNLGGVRTSEGVQPNDNETQDPGSQ